MTWQQRPRVADTIVFIPMRRMAEFELMLQHKAGRRSCCARLCNSLRSRSDMRRDSRSALYALQECHGTLHDLCDWIAEVDFFVPTHYDSNAARERNPLYWNAGRPNSTRTCATARQQNVSRKRIHGSRCSSNGLRIGMVDGIGASERRGADRTARPRESLGQVAARDQPCLTSCLQRAIPL